MNRLEALRLELDSRRRTVHDLQGKLVVYQHPATLTENLHTNHEMPRTSSTTYEHQRTTASLPSCSIVTFPPQTNLSSSLPAGRLTRITSTLGSSRSKGEAELEITNRKMMHKENKSNRE
jgi:hypothetical protein